MRLHGALLFLVQGPCLSALYMCITKSKSAQDNVAPGRGGQKKEALKVRNPDESDGVVAKKPAAAASGGGGGGGVLRRPAAARSSYKLTVRHSPPERKEAYILHDGKYLCGMAAKHCVKYMEVVTTVLEECKKGEIKDKEAAVRRMERLKITL